MDPPSYLVNPVNRVILSLFRPFVKRRLDDLRADKPPPYVNLNLLAHTRKLHRHVCEANILFEKRSRTAGRYLSNSLTFYDNFLIVARNTAFSHLETGELALHATFFLTCQRFAADEVALIQLANPSEIRLKESSGFVNLVTVQSHSRFESQRIAGSESTGNDPGRRARVKDLVPKLLRAISRRIDFESVFTGVTSARNNARNAVHAAGTEVVILDLRER